MYLHALYFNMAFSVRKIVYTDVKDGLVTILFKFRAFRTLKISLL